MMNDELRQQLVESALAWERKYGVAPSITTAISEHDAAIIVGMSDNEYSSYMLKERRTAVSRGHDFKKKEDRYQVKAHRPSGKPGSNITNAGKAENYNWDFLVWIRYDEEFKPQEAWEWDRESYKTKFEMKKRITPQDMRGGHKLDISMISR
jgi:hypothetical protein